METSLRNLIKAVNNRISLKGIVLPVQFKALLFIISFLPTYLAMGQSQTFNANGTFTVPVGVSSITVQVWGGGAGGGNVNNRGNGGGGGGAFAQSTIAVSPMQSFPIVVGTGGPVNTAGGISSFNGNTVVATGGSTGAAAGIGGAGGTLVGCIGTITRAGGNGGNGANSVNGGGGGGGSSASSTPATGVNGANASGGNGGAGGNGADGDGGRGATNGGTNAASGTAPGGGGGGNSDDDADNASGANGRVLISYTQLTYKSNIISISTGASTWCPGETRNISVTIQNTGTATWTDASPDINIGVKWNTNGANWTDYHVRTDAGNLAPGATYTYTLPVTASNNAGSGYTTPLASGSNNLIFDVVYEGVSWFADNGGGVGPGNVKFTSPAITIGSVPTSVGALASPNPVCENATLTLTGSASGATGWAWTGPNGFTASVQSPTIPNISLAGSGAYTLTASNGCGSATPVNTVNVSVTPKPAVSAGSAVCIGSTITLSPVTGGTWTSSNNSMATVTNAGVVTGVGAGAATFTYTQTSTGCSNTTSAVTVNTRPAATINSPATSICNTGSSTNITGIVTATGNWTLILSNGSTATGTGNGSFSITVSPTTTTNYTITSLVDINCSSIPADLSGSTLVTVNEPVVIVNQPQPIQTICSSFPVSFTVNATGTGLTYQWFLGSTALADNSNISGSNTATLNITQVGLADAGAYHVVITGLSPCTPVTSDDAILNVIQDIEIIDQPANQIKCAGETATFTVNAIGTGLTYQWRKSSTPLVDGGNISGATTATLTITNVSGADAAANYNVVISGSGGICPQTISANAALIVKPIPDVIAIPASQAACSGANITNINFTGAVPSTTFNWIRDNPAVTGTIGMSGSGNISGNLVNSTNTPVTVTFTITPTASGCTGSAITATVIVNPTANAVPAPSSQSICSGAAITTITSTSSVSGTTYTWTRNNPAVTGTIANSGSGDIIGTLINSSANPVTITFTITPTANGCVGTASTATVLVYPSPVAIATPASQSLCNGSNITPVVLSSATGGTTFSWTRDNPAITGSILNSGIGNITGTLINSGLTPVTVTFTITPSANGCPGVPITATVLVNPTPDAFVSPASQTKCSGTALTTIGFTGNIAATVFNWTRNNTATVTGMANSGTGNISGTLNNTTNAPITVTFTITPTINGCPGTPITATVLVEPSPSVLVTPATQNICNNTAVVNMLITNPNNVAGTAFTWTRTNTALLTGIAASGSGNSISGTLTNSTGITQTSLFNIIATAGNGCTGTATGTVNVYATETASVVSEAQTVCIFSTPAPLTGTAATGGSGSFTYQWQSSPDNATWTNIAGATSLTYQPPGIGLGSQNTFYRLRAIGACGTLFSNSIYIEVVSNVGFTFDVDNGLGGSGNVCPSTTFTPTISSLHFSNSAVRFTWSANPAYITPATGGPVGTTSGVLFFFFRTSNGNIGPLTTMNATNAPVTTTITITPNVYEYPGPPSGAFICSTTPQNITVTINPTPTVNAITNQTVCNNAATTAVNFSGFVPGTVYNWTNNTPSIGLAASGSGNIPSFTATNAGVTPVTATITVTPSFTSGGRTCTGAPKAFTITVNPAPTVNVISNQTVCNNASTSAVNFSGSVTGTVYNWTNNTTSIGLAASGTGNIPAFTALNPGITPVVATITVTPSFTNGSITCTGTPRTFTITVNPDVSAGIVSGITPLCIGATATYTSSGNAAGTWSSSNTAVATVNSVSGLVTAVAAGTTNITFTISAGCSNPSSASKLLTVSTNANAGIVSGSSPICISATTTYTSNGDAGGTWSSSNNAIATVNPSTGLVTGVGAGTVSIIYTVPGCNAVPSSKLITISPNANAGTVSGTTPLCIGATVTYTSNGNSGGSWSSSNNAIATVNPVSGLVTAISSGTVNIIYTVSAGCNNPVSSFKTLNVGSNANAGIITGPSPLCIGSGALYFSSGDPGGSWSSSNTAVATVNSSTGFVNAVGGGTANIIYTVNTGCNSPVSNFKTLTVSPSVPAVPGIITGPSPVCANTAGFIYSISAVANATTYTWAVPVGWSITSGQGTTSITVTSGNAGGNITVTAGNVCGNSGPRSFSAIITANGTWLGITSSNWNNGSNWCGGVPTSTTNVIIPSGTPNDPVVSSAAVANDISIATGATLTVTGAAIQVKGVITANNNFMAINGTVELNGNTTQTIAANTFQNNALGHLIINNSVDVNLAGPLDIYGSLTYGTSGTNLKTNDVLTLKSTAANTAWLGNMTGKTIVGNVTVERYIPNHSKAWQFLAVPVSGNQTVNEAWQDTAAVANQNRYPGYGTMLTGNVPGAVSLGFDVYTPAGPSIKIYDAATGGYNGIPNTKSLPITNSKGYMVLVRGDRSVIASNQPATATTLRAKGKLFTPADAAPVITVAAGTFESVGNPYASAIDFSQVAKGGGVQTDFYYMWDPKLTTTTGAGANSAYGLGGFQTFSWNGSSFDITPGGGSYGSGNRYIESGQAFFVRAPFAPGTVTFSEASKVTGSYNVNRVNTIAAQLRTNLHAIAGGSTILIDGNLVQYDPSYSNSIDMYDALKLNNTSENLGLARNGNKLAVERRGLIQSNDTIFYNMGQLKVQQYKFEFIATGLGQTGLTAFLEDIYLHTSTPVNLEGTTTVMFNVINVPGSYAADRFRIVFRQIAPLPVSITSISAIRNSDKTIAVKWKVESETSMQQYTIERSAEGRHFTGIITTSPMGNNGGSASYAATDMSASNDDNFYRVKALSLSGQVQYSNIVKVGQLKSLPSIEIYPNPVTGRTIQVQFSGQAKGTYSLSLISANGQQHKLLPVLLTEEQSTHSVKLPQLLAAGIYQLQITGPQNMTITKSINIAE